MSEGRPAGAEGDRGPEDAAAAPGEPAIPRQSLGALFLRFLRFGCLAWGGPVAQIAMIKRELVEEERWVSVRRFNRVLAVYQVLPGPEAHELCVYFGMLARGRAGAIVAGLCFMLPGFVLMLLLSWAYVAVGISSPAAAAALAGLQAVVVALVVRAVHRISEHAVAGPWLWAIAVLAFAAELGGVHFGVTLALAGAMHAAVREGRRAWRVAGAAALLAGVVAAWAAAGTADPVAAAGAPPGAHAPSLPELFARGLRGGLLTFGGAYTVIPFLRRDAVVEGAWMTNEQFLDGIALGGVLPAPLIIFSTFVGYLGGGPWGAVAMTAGIFLPAFGFTLVGHGFFERVTEDARVHSLLDGVVAGVVGIVAATTVSLFRAGVDGIASFCLFGAALAVLYTWKSKAAVPAVVLAGGLVGLAILR